MFLGIDIGGTGVKVGSFRRLDDTEPFAAFSFPVAHVYEADFLRLRKMCLEAQESGPIEGIGIAIAGVLDKDRTMLARAGNTAQWVNQPFVKELGTEFGCPVVLGNDAEAAAMAEAMYGNPDEEDFWLIIWGTGVGGTLVRHVNGRPVPFAGEMGHMQVGDWFARICACGQDDCLETYCGGDKILEYEGVPAEQLSPEQWDKVLEYMALGLRNIVTSQPVPAVYFSGGIAAKQSQFISELERMLREELCIVEAPSMHLSRFGESAGTVGALAMLKSSLA